MIVQPICALTAPDVSWLWPGYFADGSLAILDGDPGVGKSLITLDIAARLSTGRPWPDATPGLGPTASLFLCAEDGEAVIRHRLTVAGADPARIFLCTRTDNAGLPTLPSQLDDLEHAVVQTGARLVVIDPIMAFLDRTVDVNGDAHARQALAPLVALAERRRCTILMVRHLNKHEGDNPLYRGGASIAFVAACRLGWLAERDPKTPGRLVLAQTKNNYHPPNASLSYALPTDGPRIAWLGTSGLSAAELAHPLAGGPERQRARHFLRDLLADGPRTSREIWAAALERGYSEQTIRRARADLDIRFERIEQDGRRFAKWSLPPPEREPDLLLRALHIPIAATPLDDDLPETDLDTLLAMGKREE